MKETRPPIRFMGATSWLVSAVACATLACAANVQPKPVPATADASTGPDRAVSAPVAGGADGAVDTGGAGGTGGSVSPHRRRAPPVTPPPPPKPPDAGLPDAPVGAPAAASLDDLEDCENAILPNDGRSGTWYSYLDTFGSTLTPAMFMPEAGGSPVSPKCAVHVKGMTVNEPAMMGFGYAGVGFGFTGNMSFDASKFAGIRFWAKGTGQIRVAITLPATSEVAQRRDLHHQLQRLVRHGDRRDRGVERVRGALDRARPGRVGHGRHLRAEQDDGRGLRLRLGLDLRRLHRRRRLPGRGIGCREPGRRWRNLPLSKTQLLYAEP